MLGRREFLGGMAALSLAGPVAAAGSRRLKQFGIQLYSLRVPAAADPVGTLRRVKAMGYAEVELGGPPYATMEAKVLRGHLDRIGLTAPSAHVQFDDLAADAPRQFARANAIGAKYVVLPSLEPERRSTIAQCRDSAKLLTRFGTAAKAAGLVFGYHNHAWEFAAVEGRRPFDVLFGESDPDLVKIELDIFWAVKGGADVPAIFRDHAGRVALCHVKDIKPDRTMTDVGAGTIDFAALFAQSEQAGLRHYFVENDEPPAPYFPSLAASAAYLKTLRY